MGKGNTTVLHLIYIIQESITNVAKLTEVRTIKFDPATVKRIERITRGEYGDFSEFVRNAVQKELSREERKAANVLPFRGRWDGDNGDADE
jgi:hypothetical protein